MSKQPPRHKTRIRKYFEASAPQATEKGCLYLEIKRNGHRSNEYTVFCTDPIMRLHTAADIIMGQKCMTFRSNTTWPLELSVNKGMGIDEPVTVFDLD